MLLINLLIYDMYQTNGRSSNEIIGVSHVMLVILIIFFFLKGLLHVFSLFALSRIMEEKRICLPGGDIGEK